MEQIEQVEGAGYHPDHLDRQEQAQDPATCSRINFREHTPGWPHPTG